MVLGGFGADAHRAVAAAASKAGFDVVQAGPLALAAPTGALHHVDAGSWQLWLAGRFFIEDPSGRRVSDAAAAQSFGSEFARTGGSSQVRLRGAYILVGLHAERQTAWVSHDHLGARTIHHAATGSSIFFAEHMVELLALLPSTPAPDRLALVQWISGRTLPVGRSLFSGISRLPAAHALEITPSGVVRRRFWHPRHQQPAPRSAGETGAEVAAAAFAAVGRAAAGLRRPAVKLSGGLDSACIAAALAAVAPSQPLAFARTFPQYPEADEATLIAETAAFTGAELTTLPYEDAPLIPAIREYVRRWSLPPVSPNLAIWPPLSAAAQARGVDGLFDGEGGDELFGAHPYLIADELRRAHLLKAWRLTGRFPGFGRVPTARERLRAIRAFGISGAVPVYVQRLRRGMRPTREGIGPLVRDSDISALREQDEEWSWKGGDGPLWWRSAVDRFVRGIDRLDVSGTLLRDEVGDGVPRRHPFLHDPALIETMLSIPPEQQFDAVRDRPVLRDGLSGKIPESVRTRHAKSHFTDVSTRALAGGEGAALLRQVTGPDAPVADFVRPEGLAALSSLPAASGRRRYQLAARLFSVAAADCWLRYLTDQDLRQ